MKKVTVYALSTCAFCKQVRLFLEEHAIPFTLVEVDTLDSGEQWVMTKELKKHNPKGSFPTVVIEEVVLGYDADALRRKLLDPPQGT